MTEHTLQLKCIAWFRNEFERTGKGIIIPVVNEATYKNNTFVICKGASDLIVVMDRMTIFCELKVGANYQSKPQIDFQNVVTNLNHQYFVIRSLEQFQQIIWQNIS